MLMARPYGITMTAFTIAMLAAMLTDHVVTSQFQNACCGKLFRQRLDPPASMGKLIMIRTGVLRLPLIRPTDLSSVSPPITHHYRRLQQA